MTDEERKKMLDDVDQEVDQKLAGDIATLSGCTPDELKAIAPADLDKATFEKLMAIVGDATLSNEKKAEAINAIAGLSKIAIGLAAKVAGAGL
jgi:hypothetical protein